MGNGKKEEEEEIRNKENEDNYINKKKEIDMDLLTNKFFDVKNKVKNMIVQKYLENYIKELNY